MDDEKAENDKSRPIIEILKNLLSCSEEETPLRKNVHVYDSKELQSGWQTVSCSAKYVACPRKGNLSPSVKNEASKQKQNSSKNNKNDSRKENILEKYNKYESLGVLSYDVSSWRTIVDPETHTYIKRSHPCATTTTSSSTMNEVIGARKSEGVQFIDPGGALDKHLGDFVKRQRACSALNSQRRAVHATFNASPSCDVITTARDFDRCINLNKSLQPIKEEILHQSEIKRPVSEFRLKSLTSTFKPGSASSPPIKLRPGVLLHDGPHTRPRELSPLVFSKTNVETQHQAKAISVHGFPPNNYSQHKQLFKPSTPPFFQILNPLKQAKDRKLDWLPITSTTPYSQRNSPDDAGWSHSVSIPQNSVDHATCQVKSGERKPKIFTSQLRPSIPCKVLEIPLTSSASN